MNYLKIISVGIVLSSAGLFAQDSSGVRMVGQAFPQWAETFDMEISDDVLFVANGRLDIIDVSNPENPDYIWYSNRLGYCNQVEVIGDRAYVTTGYLGEIQFYVLDISDLANPQILGKLEEDHVSPLQLKVSGNIAYIISHHSVRIYDFSEPEDIMNIAVIDSTVDFMEVDIERNYLFGYDPGDGLRIIDVSDPASPRQVNFFPYHIHITDFSYANQKIFLFVSTYRNYGVTILDVQDVMNIDSLNHIPIYNREGGVISVQDSILLTSSYGSICSYNVSDMENPIRTGRSNIGASCIAVNDLLMFVRSGQQKPLRILNFRTVDEFTEAGGMSNGDDITMVKVSGDRMFNGRIISDISDPLAPTIIGTVQVEDIRDYEIDGSFYHVITNDGYIVFDITDPANPELRADFDHTGQDIELVGDYAYISSIPYFDNEQGGLEILDVSNLDEIRVVNSLSYEEMERTTGYMISHEDYLYSLSLYSFGIFDISDAESPSLVGTNSDIYSPYGFELYENYVYILGEKRFYILDISEPDNPILVSDTLELSSWKMTVEGDYLFLSGAGWDHGNFRSYAQGVQILSIETPTVPNIAGYYQTFREASMSAVKDGICYVADVNSVLILDYAEALTALCWDKQNILPNYKLYSAFPNPFNAQTQISYDLPTSANVKLSIFDIKGRTVDVLEQGMRTLGQHRLIWNGSRFVSGTYFVRLDAGGVVNNQSVVLIK